MIGGKTCLGTARKISGLNAYLSGDEEGEAFDETTDVCPEPYFLVTMCEPLWNALTDAQRVALTDHELSHLFVEDGKLTLLPHDLEEFIGVVHRHGLWIGDVEAFAAVVMSKAREEQEGLPLEDGDGSKVTYSVNGGPEIDLRDVKRASEKLARVAKRAARGKG